MVVCDYDGTLADIVPRPDEAHPYPGARRALARLCGHPQHRAAILTGRRASEVQAFLEVERLCVIGLHGMEWPGEPIPEPDTAALERIRVRLQALPGLRLEDKGRTLAAHYRELPEALHPQIEAQLAALELPGGWERVDGKKVREFRPEGFGKGRALERLAQRFPQHHPVFIGDDRTDEEGFAHLLPLGGTAIKVGPGESVAPWRLESPAEVVALLQAWAER
nr:trehalose-phosphatase [Deinobacterium chartae]